MNRKNYSAEMKARIVLEALKGQSTMAELSSKYSVHSSVITKWKQEAVDNLQSIFSNRKQKNEKDQDQQITNLYAKIGKLEVENDFFKKSGVSKMTTAEKLTKIDPKHPKLSVREQCVILKLPRSRYYYQPLGESPMNLKLMELIDQQYLKMPFYGVLRMTEYLRKQGFMVNPKRVRRLMRLMCLEAIYPKPSLSKRNKAHSIYPYLLSGLEITHSNEVWSSDITYIPMKHGFMYLTVVMDWFSRKVLSWVLSNSLEADFCVEALQNAIRQYGSCKIFNTDQGCQYTSEQFIGELKVNGIEISMDSKGRALDNVFNERLWRSVKYENVYLHKYETVPELYSGLKAYFEFFNAERLHQGLDYQTPDEVYFAKTDNKNVA